MLRVEDTGIGMSRSFLEKAFEPFKKSNQHTSGMGVGLSVVQSILEDIGGRLDIRSELSKGTDVTLAVQLDRLNEEQGHDLQINPLSANTPHLVGRKVCILYNDSETAESPEHESHLRTLAKYVRVLTKTLGKVLKLDVHQSREWDGQEDTAVVVCPEISFAALDQVRKTAIQTRRKCPATIFIAMDVVEAETIRNDVRVM